MNETLAYDEESARLDSIYRKAWAYASGEILLQGRDKSKALGWVGRWKLHRAIAMLEGLNRTEPTHWPTMYLLGKIHQRLGDQGTALGWFVRAHGVGAHSPDVLREASLCAMDLGKGAEAVDLCRRAISLDSDDAGLVANLALALLIDGRPEEACETARAAVERDPADVVSHNVLRVIEEVIAGNRPYPSSLLGLD